MVSNVKTIINWKIKTIVQPEIWVWKIRVHLNCYRADCLVDCVCKLHLYPSTAAPAALLLQLPPPVPSIRGRTIVDEKLVYYLELDLEHSYYIQTEGSIQRRCPK